MPCAKSLKNDFSYRRLILVFGALSDKDYIRMLEKIIPLAQVVILTQLNTERTASVSVLGKAVQKMGRKPIITENVHQAIKRAMSMAGKHDIICATGSFYLAGEVKQAFPKKSLYGINKKQQKVETNRSRNNNDFKRKY